MSRRGRASVSFHHLKLRRKENMAVKRRMRKLMWLKKLYADGESEEDHFPQQQQQQQDNGNAIQWNQASIKAMEGSKDKGGGGGAAEVDGEGEDNALLEWSQDLDFDSYVAEWSVLATTGKSDGKKKKKKGKIY